jgi:hypothetical protein
MPFYFLQFNDEKQIMSTEYFYRFIRTEANGQHSSELIKAIEFYTESQCTINPMTGNPMNGDFTENPSVIRLKQRDLTPQLLFGMTNQIGCLGVYEYFGYLKRVLARIPINTKSLIENNVQLLTDQQVEQGSGISKFLMATFENQILTIPDQEVEVLSNDGWVDKKNAQLVHQRDIKDIRPKDYISLIKRFV